MIDEFEIIIREYVDTEWDGLFEGFSIEHLPDGTTRLRGEVADQPVLHGLLMRISMLGWSLLRMERSNREEKHLDLPPAFLRMARFAWRAA